MSVYNIDGLMIGDYHENISIQRCKSDTYNTNYILTRVNKKKTDGSFQYPFLYCPNGMNPRTQSPYQFNQSKGFDIVINAGIFDVNGQYDSSHLNAPLGITIENGQIIRGDDSQYNICVITIDANGDLSVARNKTAQEILQSGVVSACVGIGGNPIIENYEIPDDDWIMTDDAQRQVLGQFGNGDYAILTFEGRSFDNSTGCTTRQVQEICKSIGLKYAVNLDGGGSVQTVVGKKILNTVYENTYGRLVPTYIAFNGTSHFVA